MKIKSELMKREQIVIGIKRVFQDTTTASEKVYQTFSSWVDNV